jgi:hypothetical protein
MGGAVPAATGGTPGTGVGGATGLWNIRVNSPGSADDGATGRADGGGGVDWVVPAGAGGVDGVDWVVPAELAATPGTGVGGATGLWNIRVNSPGSDDDGARRVGDRGGVVSAATGGTPGAGAAAGEPASGRFQKPALENPFVPTTARSCSSSHSSSRWYGGAMVTTNVLPWCSPTSISFAIDCGGMARKWSRMASFSGVFPPTSTCTTTSRPVFICSAR